MSDMLPPERFEGTLSDGASTAPIAFMLRAGEDCRLIFDVEPGDQALGKLSFANTGRPGLEMPEFSLKAESAAGNSIESDSISILQHGHSNEGHTIRIEASAAIVVVRMTEPTERPLLRLWFRSFKSWRNPTIETPLGTVSTHGDTKVATDDILSGCVEIWAPEGELPDNWRAEADKFLTHMHRGISLVHGGRLQTPRFDDISGHEWKTTFFSGDAFRSEFPVQHQLNHGPMLQALVDRYFSKGPLPEILWTALGWMQSDTTFDDLRFLTAMTALETIIESELPEKRGTTLAKPAFKTLRGALDATVAASTLSDIDKAIFSTRLAGINRKSFAEKINALFDHYQIPRTDFEGDAIPRLVKLRNDIVHRGQMPDGVDGWPLIILVRELITRILLSALDFKGSYCCYVGGLHDRQFARVPKA